MEELIVLIIRGIEWLFSDKSQARRSPPPPTGTAWPMPGQPGQRPPPPPLPQQQQQLTRVAPRTSVMAVRTPPAKQQRRRGGRAAATTVAVADPILTLSMDELAAASPAAPPLSRGMAKAEVKSRSRSSVGNDIRGRLTPAALRQQVVLSEILRPPVALRDER